MDSEGRLVRVVMAMEIEISENKLNKIRYDFNKLLQAESEFNIIVFQQQTEKEVEVVFEYLKEAHEVYQNKSQSSYLMCGWVTEVNKFKLSELHDTEHNSFPDDVLQ